MDRRLLAPVILVLASVGLSPAQVPKDSRTLPPAAEMAAAREDVWGEAALRHPDGPSFEFFKDLLPPLRYVNTAFKHYPIVLSAPLAPVKARWVSNGSGINLKADKPPMWKEAATPIAFVVGENEEAFGSDVKRLDGPRYADGFLPIVQVAYSAGSIRYEQEAFVPARGPFAELGAVCVRFTVRKAVGRIAARVGPGARLSGKDRFIADEKGRAVVRFGPEWTWDADRHQLTATVQPDHSAELVVFTKPAEPPKEMPKYDAERATTAEAWKDVLARGARVEVPEPVVQNAWRALVIGNFMIAVGNRMHYSAGNAYDHLYEAECGDAVRSLLWYGHTAEARQMLGPLLDFNRQATRFHVAGHKLQLLAHYFWVTRDKEGLKALRPRWDSVIALIRDSRKTENGLLPKDRYAGDINEQVYSLNSNAACWRGLQDMAALLDELGERDKAFDLLKEATAFRSTILEAVTRSQDRAAKFIPVSLLAGEKPHDPLTATRTGSYYDLIIPYVLGSGVFEPGDEREGWIVDYLRNHGGVAMGMIRSMPHQGEFKNEPGVNVLYGLRYNLALLRRGDRDHALVGFYGHLAQAMTRDTFVGGEGSRFLHGDRYGRSFYLPPNSASNATFLVTLRHLLIQDWDLDDDGKPDTLRLCDAIPPRWLKDGAVIAVERAPSQFGDVSFRVKSRLTAGDIIARVESPQRAVSKWTLRLPNPPGHRITKVTIGDKVLQQDADGRVDLTLQRGKFEVHFQVEKQ